MPYTKLDAGIIYSTVWREPPATVKVWITMLAMADKHGEVMASVPGLMDVAKVTREECDAALACFLSPDPDSRTQDFDGRRIERIEGGWSILNHAHYRAKGDKEDRKRKAADRAKRYRERQKGALQPDLGPILAKSEGGDRHADRHAPSRSVTQSHDKQLSSKQSPEADVTTRATTSARHARRSWLDPLWRVVLEFAPKASGRSLCPQIATHLKPLVDEHGMQEVCDQFRKHYAEVGVRFASPAKCAQGFGTWKGTSPGHARGRLDRSAEAVQRAVEKTRNNGVG